MRCTPERRMRWRRPTPVRAHGIYGHARGQRGRAAGAAQRSGMNSAVVARRLPCNAALVCAHRNAASCSVRHRRTNTRAAAHPIAAQNSIGNGRRHGMQSHRADGKPDDPEASRHTQPVTKVQIHDVQCSGPCPFEPACTSKHVNSTRVIVIVPTTRPHLRAWRYLRAQTSPPQWHGRSASESCWPTYRRRRPQGRRQ